MELEQRDISPTLAPDTGAAIRLDLEPLYVLEPEDYNRIINQLTNMIIATVLHLKESGDADLAQVLAEQVHQVLLNYDEDVAEHVRLSACLPVCRQGRQSDASGHRR